MENNIEDIRNDVMRKDWTPPTFSKVCTMCGQPFETTRNNKNICSWECKREHVRQHSRFYSRMKKYGVKGRIYPPCIICGFSETTDQHREGGDVYTLCPNHHCLITRNIKTLRELILQRD